MNRERLATKLQARGLPTDGLEPKGVAHGVAAKAKDASTPPRASTAASPKDATGVKPDPLSKATLPRALRASPRGVVRV